jgi:hypothetical protein
MPGYDGLVPTKQLGKLRQCQPDGLTLQPYFNLLGVFLENHDLAHAGSVHRE